MKHIQSTLHIARRKAWRHMIAIHHIDNAVPDMEQTYLRTGLRSRILLEAVYEMKRLRIEEYFEYKHAENILKDNTLFTA